MASLTELSASPWGATNDPTRLPELRHNLRLIVDLAKSELDGLATEAKALQERKKWIHDEEVRLRKVVSDEANRKHDYFAGAAFRSAHGLLRSGI